MSRLAVVDIGTNSIHMVLAEIDPDGGYTLLDRVKDMTRLGDGTFQTRRLSDQSMGRGIEVLKNFTTLARNKGYNRIVMTATSAVREAKNGGEFIEQVARVTGVRVRVVTGKEEARLIYLGVRHSMDLADRPSLIIDVGGGSVELISGNRKKMVQGESLKIGAIRLKDQCLRHEPPTKSEIRNLQNAIDDQVKPALKQFKSDKFVHLIASSGMAGNLAEMIHLRRTGNPIPQLNLATLTLKEIKDVEADLTTCRTTERHALLGLDPKRVDTLLPATAVIRTLMEKTGHQEILISDKAIREGVIYDFIEKNQAGLRAEREIPNLRLRNVMALGRRCQFPEVHSRHVARLATSLFDQTQSLHGLGEEEREWLEYGALLHDIGYLIHPRQHHKHSYYLIKNSNVSGFRAEEIEMIASVARYHRRSTPGKEHVSLQSLPVNGQKIVSMLSALLRIADGLDRSHFSVVKKIHVILGKTVTIQLTTIGDSELEIWTAHSRSDFFKSVFKRPVRFATEQDQKG